MKQEVIDEVLGKIAGEFLFRGEPLPIEWWLKNECGSVELRNRYLAEACARGAPPRTNWYCPDCGSRLRPSQENASRICVFGHVVWERGMPGLVEESGSKPYAQSVPDLYSNEIHDLGVRPVMVTPPGYDDEHSEKCWAEILAAFKLTLRDGGNL